LTGAGRPPRLSWLVGSLMALSRRRRENAERGARRSADPAPVYGLAAALLAACASSAAATELDGTSAAAAAATAFRPACRGVRPNSRSSSLVGPKCALRADESRL